MTRSAALLLLVLLHTLWAWQPPAPGKPTVAAAPPASGACLASANCYPKPVNTGVGATGIPTGRPALGSCTTTPSSGQVLTDCTYSGTTTITTTGAGATIRYSRFVGNTASDVPAILTHAGSGTLLVEYSLFTTLSTCARNDSAITGGNYEVAYSRFDATINEGPRVASSNIYIHDNFIGPMCSLPGGHADGIQGYGGGTNVRVYHNTIDQRTASDVTAPIFFADGSEMADVRDNLVAGGGYSLRIHDDFNPDHGPWTLIGNRVVNNSYQFGPLSTVNTEGFAACTDNRLVTIDANYNITALLGTVSC